MANFFKEITRTEPHNFAEIRHSLDTDLVEHKQFIPILKTHHDYLQESVAYLLDEDATDLQKQDHLERFLHLWEMHARSEEEVLYSRLVENSEKIARMEGFGGQEEHDIAFQLEDELLAMDYKSLWSEAVAAKAKILATIVSNHIKEEESTMFPIVTSHFTEEELEDMRDLYVLNCKHYLDGTRSETIFVGRWKLGEFEDSNPFI